MLKNENNDKNSFFLNFLGQKFGNMKINAYLCSKIFINNKTMKSRFLFIILMLLPSLLMAQRTIRGIVSDSNTGAVIANAEVRAQHGVGVVTNSDGVFTLHTDSLDTFFVISMMGYQSQRINISGNGTTATKPTRFKLTPQARVLGEVLVMSPENILQAAIANISGNYPGQTELLQGFYRETVRKRKTYVSVTEAVCELFKRSYDRKTTVGDRVRIIKGRSLVSQRAKDTLSVHVEGGPAEAVVLDLVKNRDFLLDETELQLYKLEMQLPEMLDGRQQIVIGFSPNGLSFINSSPLASTETVRRGMHFGKFFIDKETLTFSRIEINLDCHDEYEATEAMLRKKPRGMRFHPNSLLTEVVYSRMGDKSRLSYIRSTYDFGCDWKKRGLYVNYLVTSEMVITQYTSQQPDGLPITRLPEGWKDFNKSDDLSSKLTSFLDPDFWSNYNIIEPTESLEKAVNKLKKRQ